jgi:hypothetical protein
MTAWAPVLAAAFLIAAAAGAEERGSGRRTQILFDVTPATSKVFVDGKDYGTASKLSKKGVQVTAGTHAVRLVNGHDEMEADVMLKPGQSLNFKYVFEDSGAGVRATPQPPPDEKKEKGKEKKKPAEKKQPDEEIVDLPPGQ